MRDIQMVDLKSQYQDIKKDIDSRIQNVIDSTAFINGPEVKRFQEELETYLDVKHVIPCGNGTDALQVALMALDLKPGDEVITTTFTFVATAEVIALLGLRPILVDVNPDTYLISSSEIEAAITPKTKAIIPVHLFGQSANMEEIMQVANKHNLKVVEDGAQSIGADFVFENGKKQKSGTIGDFGCTSFFPSKNLGCYGDGGALFTNDDTLAEKARMIVNHGMKVRYYHDEIGVNSRLDSIQAAVLSVKLQKLNKYNRSRNNAANYYDQVFSEIEELQTPVRVENSTHVFHQYTLRVLNGQRDALQKHLMDNGVPAMIYYPVPLHQQKAYRDDRYQDGAFPVAEQLAKEVISLPMHTELDEDQLGYITEKVKEFFK
ncbi:MAG: transcriptional regulator [Flavobacteriales bacterium]|mgnify:FL=1|nr:transcriptional regulator [Flavobacteriales bacterium]|tara:strand:- start:92544 stop:93671 length:1128 start_codon:yes stop_codon:yes gene_type:complete